MRRIPIVALMALLGGMAVSAARAADLIEDPVVVEPAAPKPDYSAWYIRGDVGYIPRTNTSGDYVIYDTGNRIYDDSYHYDDIKLKDTYSLGVGAGYRFAQHFRTDASVEYFKSDVEGTSPCPIAAGKGTACRYNDTSKADIWTVMANAYVDLPYFGPFTPYFGAGIGFANVSYGEMRNDTNCGSSGPCPNGDYLGYHDGEDSWRFASSLMAGVSFDLSRKLKLDAGYRYTRIAKGKAFGFDQEDRDAGASGTQSHDNGFNIHALRLGLRYEFF